MRFLIPVLTAAVSVSLASAALAQSAGGQAGRHPMIAATAPAALTEGEVRKVDKAAGDVTLKHGPIANLAMPPMTMMFKAKDPKLIDGIKVGDKVKFAVDEKYTLTYIERLP